MTLVIAAVTPRVLVVGADRRLTANGVIVDEESTKLTVIITADSRMVLAYTGRARCGNFATEEWLLQHIWSQRDKGTLEIIETLRLEIGERLHEFAPARMTILIAGFTYAEGQTESCLWKISNFEHREDQSPKTTFQTISYPSGESRVILAGNPHGVSSSELRGLRQMLKKAPARGIEKKIHSIIQRASRSPLSGGTVGEQCNTCILSSNVDKDIEATYFTGHRTHEMYAVNSVFTAPAGQLMLGGQLTVTEDMPFTAVPIRKRKQPCSCGSGLKYKLCHGAIEYPYAALGAVTTFNEEPFPASGKRRCVLSRGASFL